MQRRYLFLNSTYFSFSLILPNFSRQSIYFSRRNHFRNAEKAAFMPASPASRGEISKFSRVIPNTSLYLCSQYSFAAEQLHPRFSQSFSTFRLQAGWMKHCTAFLVMQAQMFFSQLLSLPLDTGFRSLTGPWWVSSESSQASDCELVITGCELVLSGDAFSVMGQSSKKSQRVVSIDICRLRPKLANSHWSGVGLSSIIIKRFSYSKSMYEFNSFMKSRRGIPALNFNSRQNQIMLIFAFCFGQSLAREGQMKADKSVMSVSFIIYQIFCLLYHFRDSEEQTDVIRSIDNQGLSSNHFSFYSMCRLLVVQMAFPCKNNIVHYSWSQKASSLRFSQKAIFVGSIAFFSLYIRSCDELKSMLLSHSTAF